jgi:hypothetical protein
MQVHAVKIDNIAEMTAIFVEISEVCLSYV